MSRLALLRLLLPAALLTFTASAQAVRNNPSYPVAYENLGDIYLRLAHEAFSQATKLQGAQPDVQRKLSGLRPLLQP